MSSIDYRPDIDGLRGVAVLSVVAFHAFPSVLAGGFVGVDIFFVISGYLITGILLRNLQSATFGLMHFYGRRIKRIFPALALVLAASYAFGWVALVADEYANLGKHIAAGASFVSNFVLWSEAGYFDQASDTKPLLHLWSLGIEEQFYVVWPLLVWLAWRSNSTRPRTTVFVATSVMLALSFYLNLRGVSVERVATFYAPYTRIWELLSGAVLACASLHPIGARTRLADGTAVVGLLLVAYSVLQFDPDSTFPGARAILPVLGAVLLIAAGPAAWINRSILSTRGLVWVGLISFPLYLWHWPLLSFARIVQAQTPPLSTRVAAVLLAFALAHLTYAWLERRIRPTGRDDIKVAALVACMAMLALVGYHTFERRGLAAREVVRLNRKALLSGHDAGYGQNIQAGCGLQNPSDGLLFNMCIQDSRGNIKYALIGDSKARVLATGVARTTRPSGRWLFIGGTSEHGAPLPLLFDNPADTPRLSYLAATAVANHSTIETAVIMAGIRSLLPVGPPSGRVASGYDHTYLRRLKDFKDYDRVFDQVSRFVSILTGHGKQVVFMVDNPALPDPKDCVSRQTSSSIVNRLLVRPNQECYPRLSEFRSQTALYFRLLSDLQTRFPGQVRIVDASDIYCDEAADQCGPTRNDRLLYEYTDHISDYAAGLVGERLNRILHETTDEAGPTTGSP